MSDRRRDPSPGISFASTAVWRGGPRATQLPERPSKDSWRGRLPDALPLLVIGAAAFAISYIAFHTAQGIGAGHLPFWTLSTITGAIVTVGAVAIIVAGGEPGDPLRSEEDYVSLPRTEYERLLRSTQLPSGQTVAGATKFGVRGGVPVLRDFSDMPREGSQNIDERPPSARRPMMPVPKVGPAGAEPPALRTAAPAVSEVRPKALRHRTRRKSWEVIEERGDRLREGGDQLPEWSEDFLVAWTEPAPGSDTGADRGRIRDSRRKPVCIDCGTEVPAVPSTGKCKVCGEPLCLICRLIAQAEKRIDSCSLCHDLIKSSDE